MNHFKITSVFLLLLTLRTDAALERGALQIEPKSSKAPPAVAYATLLPKATSFGIKVTQNGNAKGGDFYSKINYGSEFSWGLTNERVHFMLFGEVINATLGEVTTKGSTVKIPLSESNFVLAKGGFGFGTHPGKSRDFFILLFGCFEQSLFPKVTDAETSTLAFTRLTVPDVGMKVTFTSFRYQYFSLGAELNAAVGLSTASENASVDWSYSGFGRLVLDVETSEKLKLQLAPQFGYAKFFSHVSTVARIDAGVSFGVKVLLD